MIWELIQTTTAISMHFWHPEPFFLDNLQPRKLKNQVPAGVWGDHLLSTIPGPLMRKTCISIARSELTSITKLREARSGWRSPYPRRQICRLSENVKKWHFCYGLLWFAVVRSGSPTWWHRTSLTLALPIFISTWWVIRRAEYIQLMVLSHSGSIVPPPLWERKKNWGWNLKFLQVWSQHSKPLQIKYQMSKIRSWQ